ncbi:MAG TPA: TetR/AcrR family transcriptional regulator [Caulobacteraceae bacterium]|jgi:AcrR family transcriptional regulator|nr:TetR/AcrR family transcriptional regulator [Caulobacteraceae bacterium]
MPRAVGQIDRAKNEAILDAASDVLFERGLSAPLDEVARRAGVSKQTIYNHYGSKGDLVRALIERRGRMISAPLDMPGAEAVPEESLAAYAEALLRTLTIERGVVLMRLLIANAGQDPDLVRAAIPDGFAAGRGRLADFLRREAEEGRLTIDDPNAAAGLFVGMVIGQHQLENLLGLSHLTDETIPRLAHEAAHRFVKAYA